MFSLKIGRYSLLSSESSLEKLVRRDYVILCLHGMFGGAWYFESWLEDFKRAGFGALALDFRGHHESVLPAGQSLGEVSVYEYVDDVEIILAALARIGIGPERVILLGHSMGGLVAQMSAARYPPTALVLVASAVPVRYEAPMELFAMGILRPADSRKTRRLFAGIEEPLLSSALDRLVPESGRAASEIARGISIAESPQYVPALILAGTSDPIVPSIFLYSLHQHKKGSMMQKYEGGHFPMLQPNASQVADFISNWSKLTVSHHY